jgi:hypothetical protein
VGAVAAATAVATAAGPNARAADLAAGSPPVSCAGSARVLVTPGLTMTAQDFGFVLTGTFPCAGGETATITAKGTGNGSCLSTHTTVPFTVTWADGGKSRGESEATTSGPIAVMSGRLVEGAFAGAAVVASLLLVPSDPFQCGLNGVTAAVAHGQIGFAAGS